MTAFHGRGNPNRFPLITRYGRIFLYSSSKFAESTDRTAREVSDASGIILASLVRTLADAYVYFGLHWKAEA